MQERLKFILWVKGPGAGDYTGLLPLVSDELALGHDAVQRRGGTRAPAAARRRAGPLRRRRRDETATELGGYYAVFQSSSPVLVFVASGALVLVFVLLHP